MQLNDGSVGTVVLASHFFKVINISYRLKPVLLAFSKLYTQYGYGQVGDTKGKWIPLNTYVVILADFSEFRFQINQYGHFLQFLKENGIRLDDLITKRKPDFPLVEINNDIKESWTLRPAQVKGQTFINEPYDDRSRFLYMPTGTGKALENSTPVLTPSGWTPIGDLKVGEKVIARDGSVTDVSGVYPQGSIPVYEIVFADGRKLEASGDHLWSVHNPDWRGNDGFKVINTLELKEKIDGQRVNRCRIPLYEPQDSSDVDLPLDPYLLGILLGDGSFSQGTPTFTKGDDFFTDIFKELLPEGVIAKKINDLQWTLGAPSLPSNPLTRILRDLALFGTQSHTKFIPGVYMTGSRKQRLALVQGLLDTDGTVGDRSRSVKGGTGEVSFTSTSEELATRFQELIWSLGGMAFINSRITTYTYKGEKLQGKRAWTVFVRMKNPRSLFRLPRKRDLLKETNQYSEGLKLRVLSITPKESKECTCISVTHPERLFVAKDYIVTHNTVTSMYTLLKRKKRILICVLAKYMDKWMSDVSAMAQNPSFMEVTGAKGLKGLLQLAEDPGKTVPDIIVVSVDTLQSWYSAYEENRIHEDQYPCHPEDLCKHLGVGAVLLDESHEHLLKIWTIMLYTHVELWVGLSGTLISEDRFIQMIHRLMYPKEIRFDEIEMEKYIHLYPVSYQIKDFKEQKLRTSAYGSTNYSHVELEKSILKNRAFTRAYLKMIEYYVKTGYEQYAQEGDKCVVYASTIEMCTMITEHLKAKFPNRDVRRYVEKDPYENIIKAEIKVSTPGSAGTALDMPGLIMVLATNSVYSPVQNLQMLGRLRNLKDKTVKFFYLYCEQIKKHLDYHEKRLELFQDKTEKIRMVAHPEMLIGRDPYDQNQEPHLAYRSLKKETLTPSRPPPWASVSRKPLWTQQRGSAYRVR